MHTFDIFPAIDLRGGRVVRLAQGDPARQTVYDDDPAATAARWLAAGARWLHVVSLDGALGEGAAANLRALEAIAAVVNKHRDVRIQFGGGLRALAAIEQVLSLGADRVVLGTAAVENPELVSQTIARWGAAVVAVGLDARDGSLRVRGWQSDAGVTPLELGQQLSEAGVKTAIYTDIAKDGVGQGVSLETARTLAEQSAMAVIASGGVAGLEDIRQTKAAGLAGIIVGRALYEGQVDLGEALGC